MLDIMNVDKVYKMGINEVYALRSVTLHVDESEFVSIVGPSGSGKSTLMNMIGCLDIPTKGSYMLDGQEVSGLTENQLAEIRGTKIGFIFQKFNLLPKLSAFENVELGLIYQGKSLEDRKDRTAKALDRVGLYDRMSHKPSELSGGQQQRVAIARALVGDPAIILADEPTGNLDSKSGEEVLTMLQDLHSSGRTIILITHDMHVAKAADRMISIHDGEIIADEKVVRL